MSKEALKQKIDETIYENLEGDISGENLNEILNDIVDEMPEANPTGEAIEPLEKIKIGETIYGIPQTNLPKGLLYGGEVYPNTVITPDIRCYYITNGIGNYASFGDVLVPPSEKICYLYYDESNEQWEHSEFDTYKYGYAHSKFEKVDFLNVVEANPTGTPDDSLQKIQIGEEIYSIPTGDSALFDNDVQATDAQRLQALANVSNQEAGYDDSTPPVFTGKMGYVVLQSEKAGDATTTFAAQIADKPNTIFEIRDVYDLDNQNVTVEATLNVTDYLHLGNYWYYYNENTTLNIQPSKSPSLEMALLKERSGNANSFLNSSKNSSILSSSIIDEDDVMYPSIRESDSVKYQIGSSSFVTIHLNVLLEISSDIYFKCDTAISLSSGQKITVSDCVILDANNEILGNGSYTADEARSVYIAKKASVYNSTIFKVVPYYVISDNCVLKFNGGMLKNGKLNMQSSTVEAANVKIFDSVRPYSTPNSGCRLEWNLTWFGMSPKASAAENTAAISAAFNIALEQDKMLSLYLPSGLYIMNGYETPLVYLNFRGDGITKSCLKLSTTDTTSKFLMYFNADYSVIKDIGLQGNTYNWNFDNNPFTNPNTSLIALMGITGFANTFQRVSFRGSAGHGVWLNANNCPKFIECDFLYNLGFGAFCLYNRGTLFEDPWVELNGMGGIIHTVPYQNSRYASDNRVLVHGGRTENLGVYGVRGTALNYKDEAFTDRDAFVRIEATTTDEIIDDRGYAPINSGNIIIKAAKYKKTTLAADTTIQFKDSQWNDFIVYKRDGDFGITFDKDFLAGDEIYLFDYQQNIVGEFTWEEGIYTVDPHPYVNLIKTSSQRSHIKVYPDDCGKNYEIVGPLRKLEGYSFNQPCLVDFQETNWCDFVNTLPNGTGYSNPIFIGAGVVSNTIYNPAVVGMRYLSDPTDCYWYVFGQSMVNIRVHFSVKDLNNAQTIGRDYIFSPKGFFCIEYHVGDMSNIGTAQIQLLSDENKHLGYGVVISSKRFPKLNGGIPYQGTFANKPAFASNKIGIGYPYFCTDKQTTEGATNGIMIYHKGNDVWVDALGRTIS